MWAFSIRDGYWFPAGDVEVNPKQGAPSGYTFSDPRPLNPNKDQWVCRTGQNASFWKLTDVMPPWDVVTYNRRLDTAKVIAIAELEFLFDCVCALGMRYDFGATGIAAKANDARTQGGTVSFEATLEHPHSDVIIAVGHDDGFLHTQARAKDRGNLSDVARHMVRRVSRGDVSPLAWQCTENMLIPLDLAGFDQLSFALGEWYSTKFYELQVHKLTIRNMTSIQEVVDYEPAFSAN